MLNLVSNDFLFLDDVLVEGGDVEGIDLYFDNNKAIVTTQINW